MGSTELLAGMTALYQIDSGLNRLEENPAWRRTVYAHRNPVEVESLIKVTDLTLSCKDGTLFNT